MDIGGGGGGDVSKYWKNYWRMSTRIGGKFIRRTERWKRRGSERGEAQMALITVACTVGLGYHSWCAALSSLSIGEFLDIVVGSLYVAQIYR